MVIVPRASAMSSGVSSRAVLTAVVNCTAAAVVGCWCCRYEPDSEWVRRPRPRLPGPMAEMRAELGDKDLLAGEPS